MKEEAKDHVGDKGKEHEIGWEKEGRSRRSGGGRMV